MTNDDRDSFDREYLIEKQLLHTEYSEANEEYRHRNQLLHNTFYLLIIAGGVFFGLFLRFAQGGYQPLAIGVILFASGVTGNLIGNLFLKHFHERTSAEVVRMHSEWVANGKKGSVRRPLSLEYGVAGRGAKWDEEEGEIYRRGSYVHYLTNWPDNILSAETVGMFLVYSGVFLAGVGMFIVSDLYLGNLLFSVAGCGITWLVFAGFYGYVISKSDGPGSEPIY